MGSGCVQITQAEFMHFIQEDDEKSVCAALKAGLDPNFVLDGVSPIISASKRQCNGIVRLLHHFGANINDVDKRGWTPMHWAAALGNTELAEMLIEWGADYLKKTPSDKSPQDLASLKAKDNPNCQRIIELITVTALRDTHGVPYRTRSMSMLARHNAQHPGSIPTVGPSLSPYDLLKLSMQLPMHTDTAAMLPTYPLGTMDRAGAGSSRAGAGAGASGRKRVDGQQRRCAECQSTDTPQWRRGPTGMGTLCNACGLKFIHLHNRDKKNARRRELYMMQKKAKIASQAGP